MCMYAWWWCQWWSVVTMIVWAVAPPLFLHACGWPSEVEECVVFTTVELSWTHTYVLTTTSLFVQGDKICWRLFAHLWEGLQFLLLSLICVPSLPLPLSPPFILFPSSCAVLRTQDTHIFTPSAVGKDQQERRAHLCLERCANSKKSVYGIRHLIRWHFEFQDCDLEVVARVMSHSSLFFPCVGVGVSPACSLCCLAIHQAFYLSWLYNHLYTVWLCKPLSYPVSYGDFCVCTEASQNFIVLSCSSTRQKPCMHRCMQ